MENNLAISFAGKQPTRTKAEVQKRDRTALAGWEYLQVIERAIELTDSRTLELARALQVQRQRIDILEKQVALYRELAGKDQLRIPFRCIVCGHEFDLPESEALHLEGLTTCPECHNWAYATNRESGLVEVKQPPPAAADPHFRTGLQVAKELGRNPTWIAKKAREHKLGRLFRQSDRGQRYLYFSVVEFEKLKAISEGQR